MTKRDYVKFAQMIRFAHMRYDGPREDIAKEMIRHFKVEIADIFAADNPRFNREKFFKACEAQ